MLEGIARLRSAERFGFANAGWKYDAYPDLPTLDAGRALTVAEIEGPAVIRRFHTTQHFPPRKDPVASAISDEERAIVARGIVLEVYYEGMAVPAVRVPLADFFLDGCGGRAEHFSTPFVEKAPESYNCFIPMPFAGSARVVLRNDTAYDLANYSLVEWERLPRWEGDLGYFCATWVREAFQLASDTDREFIRIDGRGHLVGRNMSIATDEPLFRGFAFVMEGNNEFRIDGGVRGTDDGAGRLLPQADYLGTEDAFGLAWGWQRRFVGLRDGTTFVRQEDPALLTTYRFMTGEAIPFSRSLALRIDWSHEFPGAKDFHARLAERVAAGGGWVDYASTYYWYAEHPGVDHAPLPPMAERARTVLRGNP